MNAPVITKLDTLNDVVPKRRMLVYGDSGAGKTRFIGTAQRVPEMADVLVADIDKGIATLVGTSVSATPTPTVQAVEKVIWLIQQRDPSVAHVKTLVLDGGSELQKRDAADTAAKAVQQSDKREDQDSIEVGDYRLSNNRLLRIFRMARDLPVNLIITAWAKKTYPKIPNTKIADKTLPPTLICPDFSDGVMTVLRGMCDDVWYLYFDPASEKRVLVTNNYGSVVAKTRSPDEAPFAKKLTTLKDGKSLPYIEEPHFSAIWALYKEALKGKVGE